MVTEGPGSLVEFGRDTKEVSSSLLWFGGVLKGHQHRAQGADPTNGEHGKMKSLIHSYLFLFKTATQVLFQYSGLYFALP